MLGHPDFLRKCAKVSTCQNFSWQGVKARKSGTDPFTYDSLILCLVAAFPILSIYTVFGFISSTYLKVPEAKCCFQLNT